jgi:spore maturation protein CgeB
LPLYDYVLTCKTYELREYQRICKKVIYMPLGFAEAVHRPLFPDEPQLKEKYASDVAFIGGWEPRREEMLEGIARETRCDLKIWGYAWDALVDGRWNLRRWIGMNRLAGDSPFKIAKNEVLAQAVQGGEIYADAYAWAVSGARIGIGFLRRVCPDQHTTRTFEIPACGSMLLADRTDEHRELFVEGEEAEFFSSKDELIDKVRFYLDHENLRKRIATNGYNKCRKAGYSYKDRLKKVLDEIG